MGLKTEGLCWRADWWVEQREGTQVDAVEEVQGEVLEEDHTFVRVDQQQEAM